MIKDWIKSLRLRTLPLAISTIGMGSILAFTHNHFNWTICLLAVLTTILLQILSNLANEYGDFEKGTDNADRLGPTRPIQSGKITSTMMRRAIVLLASLSLLSGIALLWYVFDNVLYIGIFLLLGLFAIAGAVYYTMGKRAYGYYGLGDLAVFLFFGLLGVFGSYFLFAKEINPQILLPAISMGLFITAVLNVNNIRDIENDTSSGKHTFAALLGLKNAVVYHYFLLVIGIGSAIIYTILNFQHGGQLLFLVVLPLLFINAKNVKRHAGLKTLDPYLKQMVLTTLLFVITFGIGHIIFI